MGERTMILIETVFPDGSATKHTTENSAWDLDLEGLFEMFEDLLRARGHSQTDIDEYLNGPSELTFVEEWEDHRLTSSEQLEIAF